MANKTISRFGTGPAPALWWQALACCCAFCCQMPVSPGQVGPTVIATKAKDFTTDNLQNIYCLSAESELIKYSPEGQEQFRYSNRTLGQAALLDATNPFHLLLYFPEYQNVLLFDRTLSPTGQFNLNNLGFYRASAVGMASDGHLWVYDEASFRLKKVTASGQVIAESGDLSLAIGKGLHPNFLTERNQQVFLNDPATGILVFDVFGQYLKTIGILGLAEFQIVGDELIFWQEGKLHSFHLTALLEQTYALPIELEPDSKVRLGNGALFVLDKNGLKIVPLGK